MAEEVRGLTYELTVVSCRGGKTAATREVEGVLLARGWTVERRPGVSLWRRPGETGWPVGVPERIEVTAAYGCACPEVADITEEMLDKALERARLRPRRFQVAWSEEDGAFAATVAGWPSLSWLAGSPEEALAGLIKVLEEE